MKGSVWGGAGATAADGGCAARPASEQHWGGSGEIRRVGGGRAACAPDSPPRRRPAGRRRERARVRDTACLSAQPTRAALPLPPGAQPPPPPTARTRGQCGGAPGSACARGNGHPYGWAWMARRRVTAAETHTAYGRALDVSCCCFLFFFFFFCPVLPRGGQPFKDRPWRGWRARRAFPARGHGRGRCTRGNHVAHPVRFVFVCCCCCSSGSSSLSDTPTPPLARQRGGTPHAARPATDGYVEQAQRDPQTMPKAPMLSAAVAVLPHTPPPPSPQKTQKKKRENKTHIK